MNTSRNTASFTIRLARPDDAEAIHAALLGIGETVGEVHKIRSTPEDIRRDGFGPHAHFHTLIAEIGSEFAGMCLYFPIYSTWMGKPGAYVQDLFVAAEFRGLKVGEKLLRRLARTVRAQGGAYLELAVDTGNLAAQRFYERAGITHRADDQIHRITGEAFFAFADTDQEDA
jgi:ribosomal protein S18 acetylase RimI-like enzyme